MVFGLFRKNFSKLAKRGDAQAARGELGLARGEYATALDAWRDGVDDPAERARVGERLAEIERELARREIAEGRRWLERGSAEQARHALRNAVELARPRDAALLAEAEALLSRVDAAEAARVAAAEAAMPVSDEPADDPDAELDLLIQTLPEERQAAYLALGPDFRDAVLALHDGDAEGATAALAKVPGDAPWLAYERGRAAMLGGRPAEAVGLFRAAADGLGPEAAPALAQLVAAALAAGDTDAAGDAAGRFTALEGEDEPDAVALRVEVARARKQYDAAIALVRRQLSKRSADLTLWRTLGTLEEEAGRAEAAIAAYEQVMKLRWQFDPRRRVVQLDAYSTLRLARLLVARKERLDRAHTLLNALDLVVADEDTWTLALVRADAFAAEGKVSDAAAALDDALARLPAGAPPDARDRLTTARAALG